MKLSGEMNISFLSFIYSINIIKSLNLFFIKNFLLKFSQLNQNIKLDLKRSFYINWINYYNFIYILLYKLYF